MKSPPSQSKVRIYGDGRFRLLLRVNQQKDVGSIPTISTNMGVVAVIHVKKLLVGLDSFFTLQFSLGVIMQTNDNIEKKEIVERWEWHDGWGKSGSTKKVFRQLRRAKTKRLLKKMIIEGIEECSLMNEH